MNLIVKPSPSLRQRLSPDEWRRMAAMFGFILFLHLAGAILMCEKSTLQSAEAKSLCASIISGQNSEIGRMKALLER